MTNNWDKRDEVCPTCGQVIKVHRGLTKQNLEKLFQKPTIQDLTILIILILSILGAYAYYTEVAQYKEIIRNPMDLCINYYENSLYENYLDVDEIALQNITVVNTDRFDNG